jgi:hypothetical protein
MKPINEFTELDGILIETEQESQEIRELLHGMGMTLKINCSYLTWKPTTLPFVIYVKYGQHSDVEYAKANGFTLHPASNYIIKPGDEVEVRDTESMAWATGFKYVGKTSKKILVVEDKNGNVSVWDLIRKSPSPKSKAIAEIKKIAEENGIEVKIL